jgi:peptide deformylase
VKTSEKILLIGEPSLQQRSAKINNFSDPAFVAQVKELHQALTAFRQEWGFGRAIAAPQIGINKRLIALNLDGEETTMVNPDIVWRDGETFTMYDDCMCFPTFLVRVRRNTSISVKFQDEKGETQTWERLPQPLAELLQHEIDHLDGVLAVDRAFDEHPIISREAYERRKDELAAEVDYIMKPASKGKPGAASRAISSAPAG